MVEEEKKKDITLELKEKLAEYNENLSKQEESKTVKIKIESLVRKHLVRFRKAVDNGDLDHERVLAFLELVNNEIDYRDYYKTNGFEEYNKYFAQLEYGYEEDVDYEFKILESSEREDRTAKL